MLVVQEIRDGEQSSATIRAVATWASQVVPTRTVRGLRRPYVLQSF